MAQPKPLLRDWLTHHQASQLLGSVKAKSGKSKTLSQEQRDQAKARLKERKERIRLENLAAAEIVKRHRESDKLHNSYEPTWWSYYVRGESDKPDGKRQQLMRNARPKWANIEKIEEIYRMRDELNSVSSQQYDVDHVIPICGKLVCGLHVPENLEIIPREKNRVKSNKFEVA